MDVGIHAPICVTSRGIAPGDREHLMPCLDQVLDHAATRCEVQRVVLVDRRGDEQHRLLVHLLGRCVVLQQLEHRRTVHHLPRRDGDVAAHRESARVDHARDPRSRGDISDERAGASDPGTPTGVDRLLQRRGGQRGVRRRHGIEDVVHDEAQPIDVAPRQVSVHQGLMSLLGHGQMRLYRSPVQRILRPRPVTEASVVLRRGELRDSDQDPNQFTGQLRAADRRQPRSPCQTAGQAGRGSHGQAPAHATDRGADQRCVERDDMVLPSVLAGKVRHAHAFSSSDRRPCASGALEFHRPSTQRGTACRSNPIFEAGLGRRNQADGSDPVITLGATRSGQRQVSG